MIPSSQYVSFVIRVFIDEQGRMTQGRVVKIQDEREAYFQDWTELIRFMEDRLQEPLGYQRVDVAGVMRPLKIED